MANIKSTATSLSTVLTELNITVPAEFLKSEEQKAYQKLSHKVTLKGFRKGKAPVNILKQHYAPQVEAEVLEKAFSAGFQAACEEHKIFPVARPSVKEDSGFSTTQDLTYKLEVEVRPEVEVKTWEKLEIKAPIYEIKEDDVQKRLEMMQTQQSKVVPVSDREEAKDGDMVHAEAEALIDGEKAAVLSSEAAVYHIGSKGNFPAIEDALVGKKIGDELTVSTKVPADYSKEDLRDKDVEFKLKVKELKEVQKPAIDDEFAKDISEEFKTLEDLKTKISEVLKEEKENREKTEKKNNIIDALIAANEFEVPNSLINDQAERMAVSQLQQYIPDEKQLKNMWSSIGPKFVEDAKPQAKKLLQASMLCDALAEKNKIEVSEDLLDKELEREARKHSISPTKLRSYYKPEDFENLKFRLRSDLVVEELLKSAVISEEVKSINGSNDGPDAESK